jgi:hypothetical protein
MFFRYKHSSLLCQDVEARRVLYVEYRYDECHYAECRGNLVKRSSLFFPEHQRQKKTFNDSASGQAKWDNFFFFVATQNFL